MARRTVDEVLAIRAAAANGETYASLARRYSMSAVAVRAIVLRESWKHI
jgi:Mor family transcriptional regulator